MISKAIKLPTRSRDEAEKPFWISYADLMTALMTLFLVVMSITLLATKRVIDIQASRKEKHEQDIREFLTRLEAVASSYPGIHVDREMRLVEFGDRARFDSNAYTLTPEKGAALRAFVPVLLEQAQSELGRRILKRYVVEGFTDPRGAYLYNLRLSLLRSQAVLCSLFAPPLPDEQALSVQQLSDIQDLFMVGGYAFNNSRKTDADSRRVEFRLELYGLDDPRARKTAEGERDFGVCRVE